MAGRVTPGKVAQLESQAAPVRYCDTVGCEQPAKHRVDGKALCDGCEERVRGEVSRERCKARGLNTVEEMRAYCRRMAGRAFGAPPTFEVWAKNITQQTVDILVRMGGRDDLKALDRLRRFGVIDEENRLVPHDQREARRRLFAEQERVDRERFEAEMKAKGVVA